MFVQVQALQHSSKGSQVSGPSLSQFYLPAFHLHPSHCWNSVGLRCVPIILEHSALAVRTQSSKPLSCPWCRRDRLGLSRKPYPIVNKKREEWTQCLPTVVDLQSSLTPLSSWDNQFCFMSRGFLKLKRFHLDHLFPSVPLFSLKSKYLFLCLAMWETYF